MSTPDDNSSRPPKIDEIDIRTEPERVADDKVEALERSLATLQPGVQVVIERLKPTWCKGQLEKLTVDEDGIDLDYLIQNWGGHLLSVKVIGNGGRIRGSHSVELYSFDPRRYGKILRAPNKPEEEELSVAPNPVVIQQPAQDNSGLLVKLLDMMNAQRQSEIETLRTLLTVQQQQAIASPVTDRNALSGISEVVKTAQAMTQLKDIFRTDPEVSGDDGAFPTQVFDVLKMFLNQKNDSPRQPRITAPASPSLPVTRLPVSGGTTDPSLAETLSTMDANHAADVLTDALKKMDGEKREETIVEFLRRFQDAAPENDEEEEDEDEGDVIEK